MWSILYFFIFLVELGRSVYCVNDSTYVLISETPICSSFYSFIQTPYNNFNETDWEEFFASPCSSCIYSCDDGNFSLASSCPCMNSLINQVNISQEPCLLYTYDACTHWCKILVYNALYLTSGIEDFYIDIMLLNPSVCLTAYNLIADLSPSCSHYDKYARLHDCAMTSTSRNSSLPVGYIILIFVLFAVIIVGASVYLQVHHNICGRISQCCLKQNGKVEGVQRLNININSKNKKKFERLPNEEMEEEQVLNEDLNLS